MAKMLNVFKGPNAVRDFLDPGKQPYLPLVEIPETLNPFAGDRVRIFAKLMSHSPLANVKAVPAFNMMREHHRRGDLDGVTRAVESSSGNTVFSIALAYRNSMQLSRRGVVVGPSAGFALAGLLQYLREKNTSRTLDSLRGRNGEIQCVFICPDSPIPYLDEYFKYLQGSDFPTIHNEELLINRPRQDQEKVVE